MDERELPGPDPLPEDTSGLPDAEWDEYVAWREREIAAGRCEEPPAPWAIEGPAVSLSLGDAADVDPALLAAICGPDGLGGEALGPQFSQDAAADVLRPGPVLAALTEQAADDLPRLNDNELIGALQAARRLENRAAYLQTAAIAEFARRRVAEREADQARGVPVGCRAGEFPGSELADELLISRMAAGRRIDMATNLTRRLPNTLRGMAAGLIDADRAAAIAAHTACLGADAAARADEILADAAPQVRLETLARRAAALEMKLDPEAAKKRKERARRIGQRVEFRLEDSGNASIAGRELSVADALASKANVHALAVALRRAGLAGNLDRLRTMVLTDLLQGRSPFDRLVPVPEAPAEDCAPADHQTPADEHAPGEHAPGDEHLYDDDGNPHDAPVPEGPADDPDICDGPALDDPDSDPAQDYGYDDPCAPTADPARAPLPALINLTVPVGTLLGWDTTPSQAGSWGLLDPDETRDVVAAASADPRTRWCWTVIGVDGTAVAHGCSAGQHPWAPPPDPPDPPGTRSPPPPPPRPPEGPDADQAARLAELLRRLNVAPRLIAKGSCDHRHAEDRYHPSRALQHLVRARNATCVAPGCRAEASLADLDHTTAYPAGPTDEDNLGPVCRSDHRAKQAPGWQLKQPEPGVFQWTLPSGRTHVTRPTVY